MLKSLTHQKKKKKNELLDIPIFLYIFLSCDAVRQTPPDIRSDGIVLPNFYKYV